MIGDKWRDHPRPVGDWRRLLLVGMLDGRQRTAPKTPGTQLPGVEFPGTHLLGSHRFERCRGLSEAFGGPLSEVVQHDTHCLRLPCTTLPTHQQRLRPPRSALP